MTEHLLGLPHVKMEGASHCPACGVKVEQFENYLCVPKESEVFCFGRALVHMKVGGKARRKKVNWPNCSIVLRGRFLEWDNEPHSNIYWPTPEDLLAEDWILL